jgi:hypothetical protein
MLNLYTYTTQAIWINISLYVDLCITLMVVKWLTNTCSRKNEEILLYSQKCYLIVYKGIPLNKGTVEINLRYCLCIRLDGLRNTTKDIRYNIWCSASDLNPGLPTLKLSICSNAMSTCMLRPCIHPPNSHLMEAVTVLQFCTMTVLYYIINTFFKWRT